MAQDPWEALASELNGAGGDPWAELAGEVNAAGPRAQAKASQMALQEAMAGAGAFPADELAEGLDGAALAPVRRATSGEVGQQALSSAVAGLAELPAGLADAVAIGATWLGDKTGIDQQPLEKRATRKFAQAIRDYVREAFPAADEETGLPESFLASKLPGALGQGVGFIGGGLAASAAKLPSKVSAAFLGAAQNAQGQFWEALAETGGDEEKAYEAFAWGLGAGATEAAGIGGIVSRMNRRSGGALTRALAGALREGAEEAGQEALQTTLNNLIARHTYDDERALMVGMLENATLGALSGGILGGVMSAAGRPSLGPVAPESAEAGDGPVMVAPDGTIRRQPAEADVPRGTVEDVEAAPVEDVKPSGSGAAERFRRQLAAAKGVDRDQVDAVMTLLDARAQAAGVSLDQYIEKRGLEVRVGEQPGEGALTQPQQPAFYSGLIKAVEQLPQEKVSRGQLDAMLPKLGAKSEEMEWLGLPEFLGDRNRVSKSELLEFLGARELVVGEKLLGNELALDDDVIERRAEEYALRDGWDSWAALDSGEKAVYRDTVRRELREEVGDESEPARYSSPDLNLPGGKNYRELLITLPNQPNPRGRTWSHVEQGEDGLWYPADEHGRSSVGDSNRRIAERRAAGAHNPANYTSGHFGDIPNVLAHIRFDERTDADGRRVLFVQEVQSDWHQEGRKKGYGPRQQFTVRERNVPGNFWHFETEEEANAFWNKLVAEGRDASVRMEPNDAVPDAPFKSTWHTLAMKRAVRWAAEHGFDAVGWTTGRQQVQRYEDALRRVVQSHSWATSTPYNQVPEGRKLLRLVGGSREDISMLIDKRGIVTQSSEPRLEGKPLEEVVGKEPAKKILSEDSGESGELTVGGQFHITLYDKKLVQAANKIGRKFGAKVGDAVLRIGNAPNEKLAQYANVKPFQDANLAQVHTLPITPQLRESVMPGQPLFQTAYHGSAATFDEFSDGAIGSGEGAQAYGYGHYFASRREVAEWYRDNERDKAPPTVVPVTREGLQFAEEGRRLTDKPFEDVESGLELLQAVHSRMHTHRRVETRSAMELLRIRHEVALDAVKQSVQYAPRHPKITAAHDAYYNAKLALQVGAFTLERKGRLYEVDLAPAEDEYLLWDAPLSEQSEKVGRALEKAGIAPYSAVVELAAAKTVHEKAPITLRLQEQAGAWSGLAVGQPWDIDGRELYGSLAQSLRADNPGSSAHRAASQALLAAGIRGNKYLDGSSRARGEGSYNYVIFDPADATITRMEQAKKGAIDFSSEEGKTVIHLFETADVSTVVHELGHLFRRDLGGEDLRAAADWAGAKEGVWTREAEEKFARGFERYLADGKAPNRRLRNLFEKFKQWLRSIYQRITGSDIDVQIPKEMRSVYDRLLLDQRPRVSFKMPDNVVKLPDDSEARKSDSPISDETRSKLVSLMEETKPLRQEQTRLVEAWRADQTGRVLGAKRGEGTAGERLQGMVSELSGEAPKVRMENLEERFTEQELAEVQEHFLGHQLAEEMSPQEHGGLWLATQKLLRYGEVPPPSALEKLSRIFGEDFGRAVGGKNTDPNRGKLLWEILNTPRAIKASADLSAAGRQGLSFGIMHPTMAAKAFGAQLRALKSQEYADAVNREMRSSKLGRIFRRAGGELTLAEGAIPSKREEAFMSTWLQRMADAELTGAGKLLLPVKLAGKVVKASDRAYVTYLNKLRLEVFTYWWGQYANAGQDSDANLGKLARWVNAMTGRGKAGPFEGEMWNAILWSPRFTTSRFEAPARSLLLAVDKGDPVAMRAGWRALTAHAAAVASLAALVKAAAEAFDEDDLELSLDTRSSDFLKLRQGDTRIDVAAGYGPAVRLVSDWVRGERVDIRTGKESEVNPLISLVYFLRNKLAPVPSVALSHRLGKEPGGDEPTAGSSAAQLVQPIIVETFQEVMREHGANGLTLMIPEVLGFGVQIREYQPPRDDENAQSGRTRQYDALQMYLQRGDNEKAKLAWDALMSDQLATASDGESDAKRKRRIRRSMEERGVGEQLKKLEAGL